ncbi:MULTISPECIES: 30S ribosomal protein S10 [16SrI (Aster yellows group)]|uniref:Small ribosomal subunit protein uS10 n=1 Tax=Rhus yellows phytoplasma TaxID=1225349 RepID=A0ABQ5PTH0_9MOLU|nr:30S ribosomal protein S10 [Mulberry dwarf phytoplasma]GLH61347.1 30S ribosomal protein S10 [Rhus yellows phytoplasma]
MNKKEKEIIKIILRAYDHHLIDQAAKKIIDIVTKTGANIEGPIPLPTRKEVFTVLRSPFVNKDSREQFERRTHKRLIQIINPNKKTIESLMHISLPPSIDILLKKNQ